MALISIVCLIDAVAGVGIGIGVGIAGVGVGVSVGVIWWGVPCIIMGQQPSGRRGGRRLVRGECNRHW